MVAPRLLPSLPAPPPAPAPAPKTCPAPTRGGAPGASSRGIDLRPLPARSILRPARGLSRFWPCADADWTVNPYRGCEIGCVYCHARYTHEFIELGDIRDFERRIFFKAGAPDILARELERRWRRQAVGASPSVAIGTVTDPYQPVEESLQLTRGILSSFVTAFRGAEAHRRPRLRLTTKSDLVLRDLDLLRELARGGGLRVSITITTLDHDLARALEPRAPSPRRRLSALLALREAGIEAGVLLMPLIPGVNDGEAAIEALAREAKAHRALYLAESPLLLPRSAWDTFFRFLRREYPQLEQAYREVFEGGARAPESYREKVRRRAARARRLHGLLPWPLEDARRRPAPKLALGPRAARARPGGPGRQPPSRTAGGDPPAVRQLEFPGL